MKIATLCAASIFCSFTSFAQDEWFTGAIVRASGDTVIGSISAKSIESDLCRFRAHDGTETDYSPEDIKAFWIQNGYSFQTIELPDTKAKKFATLLARGKAELLKYKARFFLIDSLEIMFELETIISQRSVEGRIVQVITDKFRQTLMWKFSDCDKATGKISSTTLTEPSLIKLFNIYNSCFGDVVDVAGVTPKRKSSFYVGVEYGFLQTNLGNFSDQWDATMDKTQFRYHEQSFVGIFTRYAPGHFKGISFDVAVQKMEYKFESLKSTPGIDFTYSTRYQTVRVPIGISYSLFSWRNVQPFIRLAAGVHFNSGKLEGYRYTRYPNSPDQDYTSIVNGVHSNNVSIIIEPGVNIKAGPVIIGVRGSLERMSSALFPNNISFPYSMKGSQNSYGVIASAGYNFSKK